MASTSAAYAHKPSVLSTLPPVFSLLHDAKNASGKTFEQIAKDIGRAEWYTAAIFYGQAKPEPKDLEGISKSLGLEVQTLEAGIGNSFWPDRGLGPMPPTDPVIYRLYECILVYGYPLKHIIHEKAGDGIMSAIDFEGDLEMIPNPEGGKRVKITLNGKFLPYKRF